MRSAFTIAVLFLTSALSAAEVPTEAVEHKLVRITLQPSESAIVKSYQVIGQTIETARISISVVDTATCYDESRLIKTCIFTGPPGSYSIDVFGGDRPQSYACEIVPDGSKPKPPKPDDVTPAPTPKPPAPIPTDIPPSVLNRIGIGNTAYLEAIKLNDKAGAASTAKFVADLKTNLHQGRVLPTGARLSLKSVQPSWQPWSEAVLAKIDSVAAGRDDGSSIIAWLNYCHEIQSGLEAAAK
jgi:hypothetical protein